MGGAALPEELGVGAADVIGVEGQGVDQTAFASELVADLADPRCEDWRNHLDCFSCGRARCPLWVLPQARGVGCNPVDRLAACLGFTPIEEFAWSDDHFLFHGLQLGALATKQRGENLVAARVEEWSHEGGFARALAG